MMGRNPQSFPSGELDATIEGDHSSVDLDPNQHHVTMRRNVAPIVSNGQSSACQKA